MGRLIDEFRTIFNNNSWKYYADIKISHNPFDNVRVVDEFIYKYFKTGNKERVLDPNIPIDTERDLHTLSAFFLGIFLKPLICDDKAGPFLTTPFI